MLITLLVHEFKSRFRARLWQRGVAIAVILTLVAAYFLLVAIGIGILLPEIMREAYPDMTPLAAVNSFLIYYFIADLSMRFFLQSYPLMAIQPYLLQPISRRKLYHFLMLRSIPEFFNILPYFILIPFLIVEVFPNNSAGVGWTWLALVSCMILINHYLGFYLKRSLNVKPGLIFLIIGVMLGLYFVDTQQWLPISSGFAAAVEATLAQPIYLLVPLSILAALYFFMLGRLKKYAYLDSMLGKRKSVVSTQQFEVLNRFGKIGEMMQMDLKLIWRNKRPRAMVTMSVLFIVYPLIFDENLLNSLGFIIFLGVLVIGMMMNNYGQLMLSWESSFFDLLMSRRFSIREYYDAKFYLFAVANIIMLLITSVYGFKSINFPLVFTAIALFNIGFNSFLLMFFSTFNTKRIDLGKQAFFNYEGINANQFVMILPLFLVPMIIYWPFVWMGQPWWGVVTIGILGIVGILMKPFMLDIIVRQFEKRKYAIVSGFREK